MSRGTAAATALPFPCALLGLGTRSGRSLWSSSSSPKPSEALLPLDALRPPLLIIQFRNSHGPRFYIWQNKGRKFCTQIRSYRSLHETWGPVGGHWHAHSHDVPMLRVQPNICTATGRQEPHNPYGSGHASGGACPARGTGTGTARAGPHRRPAGKGRRPGGGRPDSE